MKNTSLPHPGLRVRSRHQSNGLKAEQRIKGVVRLNWEWYGAWIGIFNGALIVAGVYYFASGRPTASTGMAPGLPLIGMGAFAGAVLCGIAKTEWPDKKAPFPKSIRLLYRIFIILAILSYTALLLSAIQTYFPLPPGWRLPL